MQIAGSGRFVFIAQWVAAVVLPAFFFIGREFIGGKVGWLGVIGIVYGVVIILFLLIPPILTLFDRDVRKAKATRRAYDIASFVLWGGFLLGGISVPDAGDSGHLPTAITTWTGGAIGDEASTVIFTVAAAIILLAYLAVFVIAIVGIVRSRRTVAA